MFVERLWHSVKYKKVYLYAYDSVSQAKAGLAKYFPCIPRWSAVQSNGAASAVMLDPFYGSLSVDGDWQRGISDRGFSQARNKLLWQCLEHLNTFVVNTADELGLILKE